jgi:hypothetical protein
MNPRARADRCAPHKAPSTALHLGTALAIIMSVSFVLWVLILLALQALFS